MSNYIKGIDVSRWQGEINWDAVAEDGVQFAMIKCGGSDFSFYEDPNWESNVTGAAAAGIKCGAYYYVGAKCVSWEDGYADGKRAAALCDGFPVELPLVIDFEAPTGRNKAGNTAAVRGFCAAVSEAGYLPMVYASVISGFGELLNVTMLQDIPLWVAKWSAVAPAMSWEIWQWTSEGRVDGITGPVDLDYMTADAWRTYTEPAGDLTAALLALRAAIDAVVKLL